MAGLPSTAAKELFISGCAASAWTSAYPMRWVKLTLPPRPRARWLLITMRLSTMQLGRHRAHAGGGRHLQRGVHVLDDLRGATPRIGVVLAPVGAGALPASWPGGLCPALVLGAALVSALASGCGGRGLLGGGPASTAGLARAARRGRGRAWPWPASGSRCRCPRSRRERRSGAARLAAAVRCRRAPGGSRRRSRARPGPRSIGSAR